MHHLLKHDVWWPGGNSWLLFIETLTYMPLELVPFNQTCLLVHWKSMKKATRPMPIHQTCQHTMWCFIRQDCYIFNSTYMSTGPVPFREENCYAAAAATYHICLLTLCSCHKHRCCSNMPIGWVLLQDGFMPDRCHSISMPPDLLLLSLAYLLSLRFSICHTCWYGV